MSLDWLIYILCSIISVVTIIISFVTDFRYKHSKKTLSVLTQLPTYIKEAEELFGAGNGTLKLSYVLNKVEIFCLKSGIEYNKDDVVTKIEDILNTPASKAVVKVCSPSEAGSCPFVVPPVGVTAVETSKPIEEGNVNGTDGRIEASSE